MNVRQTGVLVAVALAALIVGSWLGPRTQAQKAEQPPPAGRYVGFTDNDRPSRVYVLDTATGHCWKHASGDWEDYGSPVGSNK